MSTGDNDVVKPYLDQAGNETGGYYLDRRKFDMRKSNKLKSMVDTFLGINGGIIALSILIMVLTSVWIWKYHNEEKYNKYIYNNFVANLIINLIFLFLFIMIFTFFPYRKVNGSIQLVRAMSNIYGADYASPELHKSMGQILGKNTENAKRIGDFLNTRNPEMSAKMVRDLNPNMGNISGNYYNSVRQYYIPKGAKKEWYSSQTNNEITYNGYNDRREPIYENDTGEEINENDTGEEINTVPTPRTNRTPIPLPRIPRN